MADSKPVIFVDRLSIMPGEGTTLAGPSKSAAKDKWVEYAISVGIAEDEAQAMTRDELIEELGQS